MVIFSSGYGVTYRYMRKLSEHTHTTLFGGGRGSGLVDVDR